MANLHNNFVRFDKRLNLSPTTFKRLKTSVLTVKKQLKLYFKNNENIKIGKFKIQGSKNFGTLIRKKNDTVDIDLAIYFYPKPSIGSIALREHVYKALYGLPTMYAPERKNKCIRVVYSQHSKIHIDVPVFTLDNLRGEKNPQLATGQGFTLSNNLEFEKWVNLTKGRNLQIIRIIRYLKSWANNQNITMPKGVAYTVLVAKYHVPNERDDISFLKTVIEIKNSISTNFCCKMPVEPFDDLLEKFNSNSKKTKILNLFEKMIVDCELALKERNREKSVEIWSRHLGSVFY